MTTQEKSEMLAKFMGYRKTNSGGFVQKNGLGILSISTDALKYHKSPDWLLPVWYKFRDLKSEFPSPKNKLWFSFRDHINQIEISFSQGTFTDLYDALVNAVQWYNSIKTQTIKKS